MAKNDEFLEQAAIFRWAEIEQRNLPELEYLNGSLNGVRLTIGQAVKAKRGGMKKGFPDISLPVPRGGYHGLFIELKVDKNKPSSEQEAWLERLVDQGYYAAVVWGADAAITLIEFYLRGAR